MRDEHEMLEPVAAWTALGGDTVKPLSVRPKRHVVADAHYAKTQRYELVGRNGEQRRKPGRAAVFSLPRPWLAAQR